MILGAGVLCWRPTRSGAEILLVHRPSHHDWSFPKGKLDPGEILPTTARRELWEETGVHTALGPLAGRTDYLVGGGKPKRVRYWSALISDEQWERAQDEFEPSKEVAERRWMSLDEAAGKLTYDHDRELLAGFVRSLDPALTRMVPIIVLRHAKAVSRSEWSGPEETRDLTGRGQAQAAALQHDLASWGDDLELYTSPWMRCVATLAPYADSRETAPEPLEALTEAAYAADPAGTERQVAAVAGTGRPLLLCSHRPVLPAIFTAIGNRLDQASRPQMLPAANMVPGEFAVLQFGERNGNVCLLSQERHRPSGA